MSSLGSSSKKKISQLELRKYMQEHKIKGKLQSSPKKIESPLAKYNEQGQLLCILCKSIVRSEAVWKVHVNAKQHKDNIELAKKLKEKTNNFTTPLKRPLTPPHDIPSKKPKSILKNATKSGQCSESSEVDTVADEKGGLPSDFFDKSGGEDKKNEQSAGKIPSFPKKESIQMQEDPSESLPEGFFDDPKLDAKARNLEYKDPIQEEWERFQKEIRDAEGESAAIIAEDQDEATNERQIDEIDEQMKNLSKVLDLEKKKVAVKSVILDNSSSRMEEDEDTDEDFEEFLDWRSKNSVR
ncbi:hypothetical protein WA026_003757 [Henosepilachna vigintioctopunctata]|uniref:Zinc finger protein 830 n=1 Tax=Henosepilachna vigintioctopunctata TaxID=420089 RepID=A0AAW1U8Q7_9CUCU